MKQKTTGGIGIVYGKKTRDVAGAAQLLLVIFPILVFSALLLPSVALAGTERLILDYGDSQFRGYRDGTKIYLKKSLKEHYPEVDVSSYRLHKVILVAWTNNGTAIAGTTAVGRATIEALNLNNEYIVRSRRRWVSIGWHPPLA